MKKIPAVITGIVAFASPLPGFFLTLIFSWTFGIGLGIGMLGLPNIPAWLMYFSLSPLLISPTLGVLGIIHGFIKIKEKWAWLGIVFSVISLIANFVLIYGLMYIGSRY